jgi:1-acyl-sn-glycerol-3-phosphate acyltransferase
MFGVVAMAVRTALAFAVLAAGALVGLVVGYPLARVRRSPAPLYRVARSTLAAAVRLVGIAVATEGRERLGDPRNVLIVANHASHLDGPLLLLALGIDFTVMIKAELYALAPMRPLVRAVGFIGVDRADTHSRADALSAATAALAAGRCVLVFPEGRRSRDGRLGDLKKGTFAAAVAARSRVVPVAIAGTRHLLPPGRAWVRAGLVAIRVLDAIEADGLDRDALTERVRAALSAALPSA